MSDRLFVLASVIASVFVGAGTALLFRADFDRWLLPSGVGSAGEEQGLVETLVGLHSASPFVSVLGLMSLGLLASGWGFEYRRGAILGAAGIAETDARRRSERLAQSFLRASKAVLPLLIVLLLSGVALLGMQQLHANDGVGEALLTPLRALHTGELFGVAHTFLWLFAGLLLMLLNVFVTRIRAARLGERGVTSFRVYEDIPQGAALGVSFGILLSMAVLAWSGAAGLVPIAILFSICWSVGAHLWPPIAESGGWRALPFVLALAVIFGDLFGVVASEAPQIRLWFYALSLAFFMVLAARIGRRTLS